MQNQIQIAIPVGENQQGQTNENELIEPPGNQVSVNPPVSIIDLSLMAQNNVNILIEDHQDNERIRENYIGNALEILRPFQDNFFYTLVGAAESLVDVHEQIGHRFGLVGNKLKFLYSFVASQLLLVPSVCSIAYCSTELKPEKEICNGSMSVVPVASYVALMAFAHVAKNYSNFNAIRESEGVERRENTTTNLEPSATAEFVNVVSVRVNEGGGPAEEVASPAVQVGAQILPRVNNLQPSTTRVSLDTALGINQQPNQEGDTSRARSL